jgi:putative DNA-invertase from lambdoid prophage Rac
VSTPQTQCAVWLRVSTGHQEAGNQVPDIGRFIAHHGYKQVATYELAESAWNTKDGYKATLKRALDDAHAGKFSVLVVWALDRLTREGAEGALRVIRQFRERGCIIVSVKESWLNGSAEIQDVLVAFAGWMAEQESRRRSERIRAGLTRRKAAGLPVGGQPGRRDSKPRKRSGYVASWEDGARRAALDKRSQQRAAGQQDATE